jgi:hypothetical protein
MALASGGPTKEPIACPSRELHTTETRPSIYRAAVVQVFRAPLIVEEVPD